MNTTEKYLPEITGFFVFIVYLFTLAPGVTKIDCGELAAVLSLPGIAHPSGYPLFTMLGYIFTLIPLPFTKVFILNLSAAVYVSAGITLFIRSSKLILKNFRYTPVKKERIKKRKQKKEVKSDQSALNEKTILLAAIFGGLVLAFSLTVWNQSTSVEVYSLHFLMINLILLFTLKSFYSPSEQKFRWLLLAFVLALGFTNHLTTMLTLPGLAYLFFKKEGFGKSSFQTIAKMLGVFFPVLLVIYSYLPLRAAAQPALNWGNPINLENIFRHVSGKQYRVWMFSSFDSAGKQLGYFLSHLPSEFAFIGIIPILLGIYLLYTRSRINFNFILITFAATVFYAINYDIHDIDSYFILAYTALGFAAAVGFAFIFTHERFISSGKAVLNMSVLLILIIIAINFGKSSLNGNSVYPDYTKAVMNSVGKNSAIFSYQWDYFVSPSLYFQHVENIRPDIEIIDKELLRRVWYFNQLENNYPEIFKGLDIEKKQFLGQLVKFERDEKYNPALIEKYYRNLMTGLVREQIKFRDFYIGPELYDNEMRHGQFSLPKGCSIVPHLFLYKVVKDSNYVPAPKPDFEIRFGELNDNYIANLKNLIAVTLANRAMYELQFGFRKKAKEYALKAVKISPNTLLPPAVRNLVLGN